MDFARDTITRDIFIPGPDKFEEGISFAEHWNMVAKSSEFHLTLKGAHRVHFFAPQNTPKKRDILSEKRERFNKI